MIIYLSVNGNRIKAEGKRYQWPRITKCPECAGIRVWGHGYVARFFDGFQGYFWIKRYRCADCGAVHTARPDSHWRGFWAAWLVILTSLYEKAVCGRWLKGLGRQRQQYWWRGFIKQASGYERRKNYHEILKDLVSRQLILSTHSLRYFEIKPFNITPHLIFAVTPAYSSGYHPGGNS